MSFEFADWLPLVQTLGWTLLHFLWQGALIGAGYALLRLVVPAGRPEVRYTAGLVALALMAVCPLLTLAVLYPQSVVDNLVSAPPEALGVVVVGPDGNVVVAESLLDRAAPWLVLAWVFGVGITAARAVQQWRGLERIAKRLARTCPDLDRMMAKLTLHFGLGRGVRVLVSEHIDTPTLIGWLKPVILIPAAVALGFPRHQIELILAHEIGHLRRFDHLVNLAQAVIETLLFYHPVVHWISREVRNDREVCCDRLVLRVTRGEPREYARTLTSLEELRIAAPTLAIAASGGVLLDRVRRIVEVPAPRLAATRPSVGLVVALAAAVALAGVQVFRPSDADLEALAAGAQAMLHRLPRPDAALLAGAALRVDPPRWNIAAPRASRPAIMPPPAKPAAAEFLRVDAPAPPMVSRPSLDGTSAATLASVRDLAAPMSHRLDEISLPASAAAPADNGASVQSHHLVVRHSVFPRYPDIAIHDAVQVDLEFAVSASGRVKDVRVVGNEADAAFGVSARKALEEWRFDPDSVPADRGHRFRQSFVFSAPAKGEEDCVRRTGSLICRHVEQETVNPPITVIDGRSNAGQRM